MNCRDKTTTTTTTTNHDDDIARERNAALWGRRMKQTGAIASWRWCKSYLLKIEHFSHVSIICYKASNTGSTPKPSISSHGDKVSMLGLGTIGAWVARDQICQLPWLARKCGQLCHRGGSKWVGRGISRKSTNLKKISCITIGVYDWVRCWCTRIPVSIPAGTLLLYLHFVPGLCFVGKGVGN